MLLFSLFLYIIFLRFLHVLLPPCHFLFMLFLSLLFHVPNSLCLLPPFPFLSMLLFPSLLCVVLLIFPLAYFLCFSLYTCCYFSFFPVYCFSPFLPCTSSYVSLLFRLIYHPPTFPPFLFALCLSSFHVPLITTCLHFAPPLTSPSRPHVLLLVVPVSLLSLLPSSPQSSVLINSTFFLSSSSVSHRLSSSFFSNFH